MRRVAGGPIAAKENRAGFCALPRVVLFLLSPMLLLVFLLLFFVGQGWALGFFRKNKEKQRKTNAVEGRKKRDEIATGPDAD